MHLATSVTATIRTGASSTLGPKKLRSLRNLLSRGKRRHLKVRSTNSGVATGSSVQPHQQQQQQQQHLNAITNSNNNQRTIGNNTSAIAENEDAIKVREREREAADKNADEAFGVNKGADAEGAQRLNGAAVNACKSENKSPHPPALQQPAQEKILYDTRIRRKNVLALNEKVAAIREYEKSPVYKRVGRLFHCSPDQIKRIVQQKDSILEAWQQRTRRCQDAKTLEMKVVRVSMLGKAVYDWLRRMIYYQDIQITDGLIQKTALQFKSAMGLQNFFPHQDWCDKFRQTYKIYTSDSKLLNIGYTQGHSVQIKDVMKDVLNECTSDGGKQQLNERDDDDDDGDDDDDVLEIKEETAKGENTKEREEDSGEEMAAKRRRLNADQSGTIGNGPSTSSNNNTLNATGTPPINRINLSKFNMSTPNNNKTSNIENKTTTPPALHKVSPPQLPPLRQLVALPLQGNVAGMPQKVLVATPITPAGQMAGAKPMTMTIIPLATIAQSQSMQATSTAVSAPTTATTANALNAALATTTATAATPTSDAEKSTVPAPMLDIKKEIKQEPVEVKQEYISDVEGDQEEEPTVATAAAVNSKQQTAHNLHSAASTAQRSSKERNINTFNPDADASTSSSGTDVDERESADDENIALANLRRLIQTQGKIVATSTPSPLSPVGARSATPATAIPPLAPKPTLPSITLTPITPAMGERQNLPPISTTAITCIPAANISAMSGSLSFTPPLPPLTKAPDAVINRLANKRKYSTSNGPLMPPIKSCSEARKYLKLLEDFALVKENFRLIGLITRADEVLRELDGDDDVDVD